jgi:hypothetical protein
MTIQEVKNLWAVEYSTSQGQFNITLLGQALESSQRMIFDGWQNDYQIFGIYENAEQGLVMQKRNRKQEKNDV